MNLGIKMFYMLILGSVIVFFQVDFIKRNIILEERVEINDIVTQDTMVDVANMISDDNFKLTQEELINKWLLHFSNNNNMITDDLTVTFELVSVEPPIMKVRVVGKNKFLIVRGNEELTHQTNILIQTKNK